MRPSSALNITISLITVFILFLFSAFAEARNSSHKQESLYKNAATVGITHELSGQNLSIFINQNKLLTMISKLQRAGYVDQNLSKTEIGFYQTLLAANVSIRYTTDIVKNIYLTYPNVDQIHVNAYLSAQDLYGNNGKSICYSFDFDRKLYQKINWHTFQSDNIKQIAPNFKTSDLCYDLTEKLCKYIAYSSKSDSINSVNTRRLHLNAIAVHLCGVEWIHKINK